MATTKKKTSAGRTVKRKSKVLTGKRTTKRKKPTRTKPRTLRKYHTGVQRDSNEKRQIVLDICVLVAYGSSVVNACREKGVMRDYFYKAINADSELYTIYENAVIESDNKLKTRLMSAQHIAIENLQDMALKEKEMVEKITMPAKSINYAKMHSLPQLKASERLANTHPSFAIRHENNNKNLDINKLLADRANEIEKYDI